MSEFSMRDYANKVLANANPRTDMSDDVTWRDAWDTNDASERLHKMGMAQQDSFLLNCASWVEAVDEMLDTLEQWTKAYPLDIFPEPDFKKAHEVLKANGMGIDSISASNLRFATKRVGEIISKVPR